MGAELITVAVAMKDDAKTKKWVREELKKFRDIYKDFHSSAKSRVKELAKIGVPVKAYPFNCADSDAERLDVLLDLIDDASTYANLVAHRDLCSLSLKVKGTKVLIFYAGEMSWGDHPEGSGYKSLYALTVLGIADRLEQQLRK